MKQMIMTAVILLLFTVACGGGQRGGNEPGIGSEPSDGIGGGGSAEIESLYGVEWLLHSFGDHGPLADPARPLADSRITLAFREDGNINGSGGCNQYFGQYTLRGEQLMIRQVGSTMMACMGDDGSNDLMDQEQRYFTMLGNVDSLTVVNGELRLGFGGEELRFQQVVPPAAAALEGTRWQFDTLVDGDMAMAVAWGDKIWLEFGADGSLQGNGGCNGLFADYQLDGSQMTIQNFAITEMACMDIDLMTLEARIGGILPMVTAYEINGPLLYLRAEGFELIYRAQGGGE